MMTYLWEKMGCRRDEKRNTQFDARVSRDTRDEFAKGAQGFVKKTYAKVPLPQKNEEKEKAGVKF